jgi:hypothetical protein
MIIGVSGRARAGKDVFGEFLAEELCRRTGEGYILMAYAYELKCVAQKEFDLSWGQLWGNSKEVRDKRYFKGNGVDKHGDLAVEYWTGREIMQSIGAFYRSINNNFWVEKLFKIIDEKEYTNVIITDVRYPNEVDPIVELNGYHIRINRAIENKIHGKKHSSETSLDTPYKVDFTVSNNGTLEDLKKLAGDIAGGILQLEKFRN